MEIFLSKKFIICILALVLSFVLVLTNKTTSDIFFKFVEIILGIYTIGNISDKVNDTRKEIAVTK